MNISLRLSKIVDIIAECDTLADIGCDHGYVGISALNKGKACRVTAADVAKGPLAAARKNSIEEGASDRIDFVLSDGFKDIPDDERLECAVIAGMGGLLMKRILYEGNLERFKSLKQLILSPQSDLDAVRKYLVEELGMNIVREYVIKDEGKYYFIFDVSVGGHKHESYSEAEYVYGKHIADESVETYREFLGHRKKILTDALSAVSGEESERKRQRSTELKKELALLEAAFL